VTIPQRQLLPDVLSESHTIREEADAGAPVVVSRPDTAGAKAFRDVASAIAARVSVQCFRQLPVINVR
jgi:hypothetical protein